MLSKFIILALFGVLIKAEDTENSRDCRVDTDRFNNTNIFCYYMKLDNNKIPLSGQIQPSENIGIILINCTGKISEDSFPNLRQIDSIAIANSKLEEIVFPELPNLKQVNMENVVVPSINGAFKNIKYLTSIQLVDNSFKIGEESFKGMSKLEHLIIRGQDVVFKKKFLEDLKNLKDLKIMKSNIEKIPSDVFPESSELRILVIAINPLKTIEAGAFDPLKKLQTLVLSPTPLEKFNLDWIKEMKDLTQISIPARCVDDLDLEQLVKNHPLFNSFMFLQNDGSCKSVQNLLEKIGKMKLLIPVGFGSLTTEKSC
ncbi:unnamed protein product [Phyllotreta striolata]|uniref:Uncharacterized protein n=1 Tax=Phyllotreta striolata TaxID=444603 RepID=A0A9N9TJE1_PHYSR|nr:unnamed protein product [Phyllotreta striolata]